MLLTPVEWVLFQLLRFALRPRVFAVLLVGFGVAWMVCRLRRGGQVTDRTQSPITLWDPQRLADIVRAHAAGTTVGGDPSYPNSGARSRTGGGTEPANSARHRTESVCRSLLERMLDLPLPKVRPKWLINPTTKRRLELDMYNEAHRIAFEYDGAQHDVFTPHYHANVHHFEYRRLLDRLKGELCRDHGVLLIRIPWSEVSAQDEVRTALALERLLGAHGVPFRSLLVKVE